MTLGAKKCAKGHSFCQRPFRGAPFSWSPWLQIISDHPDFNSSLVSFDFWPVSIPKENWKVDKTDYSSISLVSEFKVNHSTSVSKSTRSIIDRSSIRCDHGTSVSKRLDIIHYCCDQDQGTLPVSQYYPLNIIHYPLWPNQGTLPVSQRCSEAQGSEIDHSTKQALSLL